MSKQKTKKQFMYTTCSELVVFMYWTGKSMNNLLSFCGLVDLRINASDKGLPVQLNSSPIFFSGSTRKNCTASRRSFFQA